MTYQLYIGANNQTKKVEIDKIQRILNGEYDGYTIARVSGYWHGQPEPSVSVLLTDSKLKHLQAVIDTLKIALDQDAIAYQQVSKLKFI